MPVRHSWDDAEDDNPFRSESTFDLESFAIAALKFIAWLDLVAGVVGGIVVLATFTKFMGGAIAAIIALVVAMQGLVVWALFLSLASIATNLHAIRENSAVKGK